MIDDLAAQASQLFVSLLDLLVQRLIFNLELFVINQVKTFGQLLLLLQDFLLVGQSIPQGDILQTILMNFLILGLVGLFPLLDDLGAQLFARAAVHGVHSDRALELLELLLDLRALSLLLVELVLELTGHSIVTILRLFQVVPDLMNVSEGVEIFVLVEHLISALVMVTSV